METQWLRIVLLALFLYLIPRVQAQLLINEFMSDNESTLVDNDGDYSDWLEIYNASPQAVSMHGYYLSDDPQELQKWAFPIVSISAHGFRYVFASGKGDGDDTQLHTNFKIASEGEIIYLSDSLGNILDQSHEVELGTDQAYGRLPDGCEEQGILHNPSPGTTNLFNEFINCPIPGGFYSEPFLLTLVSMMGDTIRYTTDGSTPNLQSPTFKPIDIGYPPAGTPELSCIPTTNLASGTMCSKWNMPEAPWEKARVFRFCAFRNNQQTSDVFTHTYFIDSTIFDRFSLPVLSLVTDAGYLFDADSGIYVPGEGTTFNTLVHWNYWLKGIISERPVHLEYFAPNGELLMKQHAGVRIHGNGSRHYPQKSMKVYARAEYGSKCFDYPLLPNRPMESHKRFLLRSAYSDCHSKTLIKDALASQIVKELNVEYQDFQQVVLFINGEYWGLHEIRDCIDEHHLSALFELHKDSIDLIRCNLEVYAGSADHYIQLCQFIKNNDLSVDSNFTYVSTLIDIPGFIDYQVAEIFLRNIDWPGNNSKLWRPQKPGGKWRWIFYDLDAGFINPTHNMFVHATLNDTTISYPNPAYSTLVFRKLLENSGFVNAFSERFAELLNTQFSEEVFMAKLDSVKQLIELEVPAHIRRWQTHDSYNDWESAVDWALRDFLISRPCIIEEQIIDFFGLTNFGFTCLTDARESGAVSEPRIHPNPTRGTFWIRNEQSGVWEGEVWICNALSQTLVSQQLTLAEGQSNKISMKEFPDGVYFVVMQRDDSISTQKVILRR